MERGLAALRESLAEIGWAPQAGTRIRQRRSTAMRNGSSSDECGCGADGTIERNTTETKISLRLTVDGQGTYQVSTGIRFFDHMLELFTRHGGFDLELTCKGDLDVDQHHTVEDVGYCAG